MGEAMNFAMHAFAAGALVFAGAAQAATFTETLDLPYYSSSGPRILQAVSAFTTGLKLTAADEIQNPSGWNNALNVSIDTVAQTISLTGDDYNTYQLIWVDITGIDIPITGLTAVTPLGAFETGQGNFGYTATFTANSISLRFTSDIQTSDYFAINTGTSVFRYETSGGAVPEPASWALMILGFGAIGAAARYRRTSLAV
jgi:hypothetical protein